MSNDSKEAEGIDLNTLVKRLPPDKVGQFEPVSGVMVLNIASKQYQESALRWSKGESTQSDRVLINTINHETFHFVQTTLCGYMFTRAQRLFNTLNSDDMSIVNALDAAEQEASELLEKLQAEAGDDPELHQRAQDTATVSYYHHRIEIIKTHAPESEHSLAGAFMPHFFAFRDNLLKEERCTDTSSLSILGVIEGAAVVYAAHLMCDNRTVAERIEADIAHLPNLYAEAWRCTQAAVGDSAADVLLPVAAVALCYELPNAAFHNVLLQISDLSVDDAYALTSELFQQPGIIKEAGEFLGTGWDIRKDNDSFRLYDTVLNHWDCKHRYAQAFELLATPMALNNMDHIPICLTLSDSFFSGQVPKDEAHVRIYTASLILKVLSRRREEKNFKHFAAQWAQGVIGRVIG